MNNINNLLSKLYKKPLWQVAKKLGYNESNVLILQDNFDELKIKYPNVWQIIISCAHNKDKRSFEDYSKDLVSSWIFEDTLLHYIKKFGINIKLNGSDVRRNILSNIQIKSDSDYVITLNKIKRNAELITSYTNYWKLNNRIDLRDNKYLKLKQSNSLVICVDLYNRNFFILDLNNTYAKYIEHHKPYNKSAYQIYLDNKPINFTIKNLITELQKHFEWTGN